MTDLEYWRGYLLDLASPLLNPFAVPQVIRAVVTDANVLYWRQYLAKA